MRSLRSPAGARLARTRTRSACGRVRASAISTGNGSRASAAISARRPASGCGAVDGVLGAGFLLSAARRSASWMRLIWTPISRTTKSGGASDNMLLNMLAAPSLPVRQPVAVATGLPPTPPVTGPSARHTSCVGAARPRSLALAQRARRSGASTRSQLGLASRRSRQTSATISLLTGLRPTANAVTSALSAMTLIGARDAARPLVNQHHGLAREDLRARRRPPRAMRPAR